MSKIYLCDHKKNICCKKTGCGYKSKGDCFHTTDSKFALGEREEYRMGSFGEYSEPLTVWTEETAGREALAWVCIECDYTIQFTNDGPEENGFLHCPKCGSRIVEFIKYKDPLEEVEKK